MERKVGMPNSTFNSILLAEMTVICGLKIHEEFSGISCKILGHVSWVAES